MDTSTNSVQETRTSAKDFFLHLGSMVALYATAISFLNLLFRIINKVFPEVSRNYYAWGSGSEISLPVATLIVAFPLFLILSKLVYRTYAENPLKKELHIRKWLTYITLFVAGIILAGDLVMVIYKFLDGQDLTAAFLLKALVVVLVTGAIFAHYLQDIRDRLSPKCRKMRPIVVSIVVLAAIVWGFVVMGSPQAQRLIRLDNQKISDLQNLQWQVVNYWQVNGQIPEKWTAQMLDTQTGQPYEYKKTGPMTFKLCAQFNKESQNTPNNQNVYDESVFVGYLPKGVVTKNEDWRHTAGNYCFEREIDPIAFPTQVRG